MAFGLYEFAYELMENGSFHKNSFTGGSYAKNLSIRSIKNFASVCKLCTQPLKLILCNVFRIHFVGVSPNIQKLRFFGIQLQKRIDYCFKIFFDMP